MSDQSGWTVETLYVHLQRQIDDQDRFLRERYEGQIRALEAALAAAEKAVLARLAATENAITKADNANEKRFASVNEFRGTLTDLTATFIPRVEADAKFSALTDKWDQASAKIDKSEGRGSGFTTGWAVLVGAITVGLALYAALRH